MKTATGRQIYSCPYCDRTGMTEGESKRHRRTHPPETRVLTCPVCGHVFRPGFGGAYLRHVAAHANEQTRFWEKVDKDDPNGCWLWTASLDTRGYGWFRGVGMRKWTAHRFAWVTLRGEHVGDLELDHLCRVRHCVNPEHLEPVTHRENMARSPEVSGRRLPCPHCDYRANAGNLARHIKLKHQATVSHTADEGGE